MAKTLVYKNKPMVDPKEVGEENDYSDFVEDATKGIDEPHQKAIIMDCIKGGDLDKEDVKESLSTPSEEKKEYRRKKLIFKCSGGEAPSFKSRRLMASEASE